MENDVRPTAGKGAIWVRCALQKCWKFELSRPEKEYRQWELNPHTQELSTTTHLQSIHLSHLTLPFFETCPAMYLGYAITSNSYPATWNSCSPETLCFCPEMGVFVHRFRPPKSKNLSGQGNILGRDRPGSSFAHWLSRLTSASGFWALSQIHTLAVASYISIRIFDPQFSVRRIVASYVLGAVTHADLDLACLL